MMSTAANKLNLDPFTWHTIQVLLEPLSRDWPEVITETLMAIEEGVDAAHAGEVLAQGLGERARSRTDLRFERSHHPLGWR